MRILSLGCDLTFLAFFELAFLGMLFIIQQTCNGESVYQIIHKIMLHAFSTLNTTSEKVDTNYLS